MDTLGRSIAIILVCILMFLFPIQYKAMLQRNISQEIKEDEFYSFVENVLKQGEMKKIEYRLFMNAYNAFDEIGHMEIEVGTLYTNGEKSYTLTEYYDELDTLFSHQDIILFSKGDYITIRLITDRESVLVKLQNILLHYSGEKEEILFGGKIS